jgi:hypothetical protein
MSGSGQPTTPDVEVPGDTGAPDIVGPTGEEMPRQEHDDVVGDDRGADLPPVPETSPRQS